MRALVHIFLALLLLVSCQEEKQSFVKNIGNGEDVPTMLTVDVNTFISDSGYTKYHITSPVWAMYEDAKRPYWKFPEGIDLEQYDRQLQVVSTMRCDSARYYSQERRWQLDGNVVMVNTQADSFLTQQVFWDQASRNIYSDSFIHIVRSDRVIEGYGFTSDERMSAYTVNRPTGIFPVNRREEGGDGASGEPDSLRSDRRRNVPRPNQPLIYTAPE